MQNMKNEPQPRSGELVNRQADTPTPQPDGRHLFPKLTAHRGAAGLILVSLTCGIAAAQGDSPAQLRKFIEQRVGGIQKLPVPAHDSDLPQPRLANGSPDPSFKTTEAKR